MVKTYNRQVDRGWLYYSAAEDCYRPTLKGAYLLAWGLLFPINRIRHAAMMRQARRILAEFEQAEEAESARR